MTATGVTGGRNLNDALRALTLQHWIAAGMLAFLFVVPFFVSPFYVVLFAKVMIWAIAAASLNLILGYGGMISFGHAAYMGIGGYVVGIASFHGVTSGWITLPLMIGASALFALVTGAICLRTRGVYFIMITLAFTQMIFFAFISLEKYGADDGLPFRRKTEFFDGFYLGNRITLYYTAFVVLLVTLFLVWRIVNSRFGMVVRGARSNDTRMQAIGFPTHRYRLACYVLAGVMCGFSGFLLGNAEGFVNPDMMAWTRSGNLIFMVVLGGMATVMGPLLGAATFVLMAEFLPRIPVVGVYWHIIFGPFLILVVLFARGGISSIIDRIDARLYPDRKPSGD